MWEGYTKNIDSTRHRQPEISLNHVRNCKNFKELSDLSHQVGLGINDLVEN